MYLYRGGAISKSCEHLRWLAPVMDRSENIFLGVLEVIDYAEVMMNNPRVMMSRVVYVLYPILYLTHDHTVVISQSN